MFPHRKSGRQIVYSQLRGLFNAFPGVFMWLMEVDGNRQTSTWTLLQKPYSPTFSQLPRIPSVWQSHLRQVYPIKCVPLHKPPLHHTPRIRRDKLTLDTVRPTFLHRSPANNWREERWVCTPFSRILPSHRDILLYDVQKIWRNRGGGKKKMGQGDRGASRFGDTGYFVR